MPPHITTMPLRQALVRSCAEEGIGPRAVPLTHVSFDAFKVPEAGGASPRTYALGSIDAPALDDALNGALAKFALFHKDTLLIRETSERGVRVHVYSIKRKSAARYVHRNHVTRAVHDLYASPVCTMDLDVIGGEL